MTKTSKPQYEKKGATMARKAKDNKAHFSSQAKHTSTKTRKRPSKERGPFGENNGTVQRRNVENDELMKELKKNK